MDGEALRMRHLLSCNVWSIKGFSVRESAGPALLATVLPMPQDCAFDDLSVESGLRGFALRHLSRLCQ